jgi:tetratricopeptide (TPR) repeat protein
MNYLLKAMGFWIWGLIAIALSVSMVSVSYKLLSLYRAHDAKADTVASGAPTSPAFAGVLRSTDKAPRAVPVDAQGLHPEQISRAISGEIRAAQKALYSMQWSEALKDLDAASAKSPRSAYDLKTIDEFRGIAYVRLNNLKAAQAAYEAAVSTGAYKAEELVKIFRLLFQLAATNKDAQAIEYGKQALDAGAMQPNDLLIMSQLYYQQKDCKNSGAWGDRAIAAFKQAGEAPKEVLYQLKLQCAGNGNDTDGMKAALYALIRLTHKTSYWNNLLRLERQDERDDRNTLMIYRIMYDTRSMDADTDYIEMAQLLGDAGLPGEAAAVLQRAVFLKIVKDEHKERTMRLLEALQTRADADINGLPALAAETRGNPLPQRELTLGETYFGAGDYRNAINALGLSTMANQLTRPEESYVYLGRAYMAQNQPGDAKEAFGELRKIPNINPRVLKLWDLYADTIPAAAAASL